MEYYHNDSFYNPENLETIAQGTLRSEYKRLRDDVNKRLKELKDAGYGKLNIYRKNINAFRQNINKMTNKDLRYALTEAHDFLSSDYSNVDYLNESKARTINALKNKWGITGLNDKNFDAFVEFMKTMRELYGDMKYKSEYIAEYWLAEQDATPPQIWDMYEKYEGNNSK